MQYLRTLGATALLAAAVATSVAAQDNDGMSGQTMEPGSGMSGGMAGGDMQSMMQMMERMGPMMEACTEMMQAMSDRAEQPSAEADEG